jgi:hypothetical protein
MHAGSSKIQNSLLCSLFEELVSNFTTNNLNLWIIEQKEDREEDERKIEDQIRNDEVDINI